MVLDEKNMVNRSISQRERHCEGGVYWSLTGPVLACKPMYVPGSKWRRHKRLLSSSSRFTEKGPDDSEFESGILSRTLDGRATKSRTLRGNLRMALKKA
jgi:hypothetical protein